MKKWLTSHNRVLRKLIALALAGVIAAAVTMLADGAGADTAIKAQANARVVDGGTWVPTGAVEGTFFYITADGAVQKDCYSSDGYYIEANGIRFVAKAILNAQIIMRNSWLTAAEVPNFDVFLPTAIPVQQTLATTLKQYRTLSVYSTHMMLSSINNTKDGSYLTDRLGLYKNDDINGYTIMISTPLAGDRRMIGGQLAASELISYYDYEVLRYFTNSISRNGDLLASAIYSHWMDLNEQGLKLGEWVVVGDTMVRYMPGNGKGLYEIKAVF